MSLGFFNPKIQIRTQTSKSITALLFLLVAFCLAACQPKLINPPNLLRRSSSSSSGSSGLVTTAITVNPRFNFANTREWNDYVRRCVGGTNTCSGITDGVTPCTGAESGGANACIHGGERKAVVTQETSCTGLTMTDNLGVFDWECSVVGGFATFYSRLKKDKGLADLITDANPVGSWNNNFVTLTNGTQSVSSTAAQWWTNLVRHLPDNSVACAADGDPSGPAWTCPGVQNVVALDRASTIFVLSASNTSKGYNINADKIAVVTQGASTVLTANPSGNQCDDATLNTGVNHTCLIAAGGQNFLWLEGQYLGNPNGGTTTKYIVALRNVVFSKLWRLSVGLGWGGAADGKNLLLREGFNYNRIHQLRTQGSEYAPFSIRPFGGGVRGNIFDDLSCSGSSNQCMEIYGDNDYNVFTGLTISNSLAVGLLIRDQAFDGDANTKMNIFSRVTVSNIRGDGIDLFTDSTTATDSIFDTIIHNASITGVTDASAGLRFDGHNVARVFRSTVSQLAVISNEGTDGGLVITEADNAKFTGNLLVGTNTTANCVLTGGNAPGITAACATANASDHNLVTGLNASGSFRMAVTSDGTNGSEDAAGQRVGNLIAAKDWFQFDNFFRLWGQDPGANVWPDPAWNMNCFEDGNTCQLLDWSLLSAATIIRNTTGTTAALTANGAFTANAACPTAANGTEFLTSQTYTYDANYFGGLNGVETVGDGDTICEAAETCVQRYLKSAVEIIDDDVGDDDGLCETGETCLYTPNFGSYQGHGTLSTCTFTGGTITGVTMYGYPTNGY